LYKNFRTFPYDLFIHLQKTT